MKEPVVSIIIPTFNRLWGLKDCIASIQAQDFDGWQVIVMDDASSEPVHEYIKSLQDSRIIYFRQKTNVGVARNWTDGVLKAKTPFLCILMDDDWYQDNFLRNRLEIFKKYPDIGLVFGGYIVKNTNCQSERKIDVRKLGKLNNLDLIVLMLSGNCFIGTAMYRTRLVQSVISEASSFGLVLDYCINLILVCRHLLDGFALSSFDFNYRQHSETISETQMDLVNFQCYRFLQRGPQLGRNFELLRKQEMCNRAMLYSLVSSSWLERVSWAFASICNKPYQLNPYKCLFKRIFNIQKIK